MRLPAPAVVSFPCGQCRRSPVVVTFRGFGVAVLFCRTCEHAWSMDPRPHAALMAVPLTPMPRRWWWA